MTTAQPQTTDALRVLHVTPVLDPQGGGTATALLALAAAQRGAGLRVTVLATFVHPEHEHAEALRARDVEVHQVGPCSVPMCRHPRIATELERLIPGADVVHIHALWEEVQHQAARICRRLGVPYVITPHGMLDPWSLAQGGWKKRLYLALRMRRNLNGAAAIHYTSETEAKLVAALHLKPRPIVEPNGVDLAEFEDLPPRGTFRARHPQLGQRLVAIILGRIHPKKGFDLLIPAFAKFRQTDAMLVIAGPDEDNHRARVETMVAQHGLQDRVIFTGMLRGRERIEALVDADLFVLPSYQENFGIAVVESLAAGTPVVISDQVNIHHEIAAAGVGGVVPNRAEPLAAEIERWLGDERVRHEAAQRARAFVRDHYDWDEIARRWAGHYASLARPRLHRSVA